MSWNAAQYLTYAQERTRPAVELASRIPRDDIRTGVDLGCGPGNSTTVLRARYPNAHLTGVDTAPDMLAKARASGLDAEWIEADAAHWAPPTPVDLLYANALFQWVDGHDSLFPRLVGHLAPRGVLAIQMPRNFDAPSHVLLRETVREFPSLPADIARTEPVASPAAYADMLEPHVTGLDIWETTYEQRLTGDDPVLNWVRGTALVPVLAALKSDEQGEFLAAYGAKLRRAYPQRSSGVTLFPFRRLFIVASL